MYAVQFDFKAAAVLGDHVRQYQAGEKGLYGCQSDEAAYYQGGHIFNQVGIQEFCKYPKEHYRRYYKHDNGKAGEKLKGLVVFV